MRLHRTLALGASLLVLFSACTTGGGSKPTIKVGSDGFYESKLMAEIYAQALEANGYTVDRAGIGLGARAVTAPALETGQFDLKPEYIGSGLGYYDKTKPTGDPAQNETALQTILNGKGGGITVLDYSPAADQNAFVVRKDTADQYHLTKMSDLAAVQTQLKWGLATDCPTNPLCGGDLKSLYGIDPMPPANNTPFAACDTPGAQALLAKTIDIAELCSTQPDIATNGWIVLADDKQSQPADNIAPLVRNDYLTKLGDKAAFEKILNDVSAKMTTATLTQLGADITVSKKDIAAVAKQWLADNGFVPKSS